MNFQVSMNCNLTPLIGAITVQLPRADLDPRAESQGRLKLIHFMALRLKLCSKKLYKKVNHAKLELWG